MFSFSPVYFSLWPCDVVMTLECGSMQTPVMMAGS